MGQHAIFQGVRKEASAVIRRGGLSSGCGLRPVRPVCDSIEGGPETPETRRTSIRLRKLGDAQETNYVRFPKQNVATATSR